MGEQKMYHPKSYEHNTFSNCSDESQFNSRLKKTPVSVYV